MMSEIARGAESVIYLDNNEIIKHRLPKHYRIQQIDILLRKTRTQKEARLMKKAKHACLVPEILNVDLNEMKIRMDFVKGNILRDALETLDENEFREVCTSLGRSIAGLHNEGIIHGDLTTSNMILNEKGLFLIDFGLAESSQRAEDKAVDLHLLYQALTSKHHKVLDKAWKIILNEYEKKAVKSNEILARLKIVEGRGRYKKRE